MKLSNLIRLVSKKFVVGKLYHVNPTIKVYKEMVFLTLKRNCVVERTQ